MGDIGLYFWILFLIMTVVFSVINASKKKAETQNHKQQTIDNVSPIEVHSKISNKRIKKSLKTDTPIVEDSISEPKEKREYSEKEKMIIYSEIMKPKFDE